MMEEEQSNEFGAVEYVVFLAVLVVSAGIGVFYGCFGSKQKSTEEFLMANRQMGTLPVSLSLICSFVSAVTLLGNPAEIYLYGTQYAMMFLSYFPLTVILAYLYVPVYFNLQISSVFEYLELRFNRPARILLSLASVFHSTVYMAVVVYGPSLALAQVTGISTKLSTGLIFVCCVFYSALGGLKAVLWTDALQAVVMFGSVVVVVVNGFIDIGGIDVAWNRADTGGRLIFFNFDPDPRTRHTIWTTTLGGIFMWLPMFAATQQQVQRYIALPSLASCRRALWYNMAGFLIVTALWFLSGLMIYAKYFDCDPLKSKVITNNDQLLPQFVMDTASHLKGIPGLFVAGITCASLSTVSSGLNAIASIVTFDYLKRLAPNLTDSHLSTISKFVSLGFGAISYGCVYIAESMEGLQTAAYAMHGLILGPSFGLFTLGMFVPWANTKGSISGVVTSFLVLLLHVVGNNIATTDKLLPDQTLTLTTMGCPTNMTSIVYTDYPALDWKNNGDSLLVQMVSMSYIWQLTVSSILSILFGLIFSAIFNWRDGTKKVNVKLLSLPVLRLTTMLFPDRVTNWVDYSEKPLLNQPNEADANDMDIDASLKKEP